MKKVCLLIILFLVATLQAEILDSLTIAVIDSSLQALHLRRDELGFKKALVKDDTFKLKIMDKILHNPLYLPLYTEETEKVLSANKNQPLEILKFSASQLDINILPNENTVLRFNEKKPFKTVLVTISNAESNRKKFYAELDSLELHDLILGVPVLWQGEKDSLNLQFAGSLQHEFDVYSDTSRTVDNDRMLDIIKKLDREALYLGGMEFYQAIWNLSEYLKENKPILNKLERSIDGVQGDILYHQNTEYGEMIIGGYSDNIYSKEFAIIIDLGGDDIYRARCGGAIGVLGNPYSAVIDFDGNDVYFNETSIINLGAGFLGYGALIDHQGNDVYRSSNYSQGVGIFGLGLLFDGNGEDDYRSGFFSQAAANVGTGILIDNGFGDDRYFSTIWAQGLGGVFGFGVLYEDGGDDTYRTGGKVKHAPLLPDDYQSFSHGFGMGWRPRAGGGIGILCDKNGNDFYDGEVYCQGASYWYSLGMLIDGGGNDSYNAAQYAQGAGIHLSIGMLWDRGGDDQYHSRNGVVGGTAHDLSVGMLIEEKGDDNYIVSGGYGTSLTNSFALFVDKLGNDMYSTWEQYSFGAVRAARGYSGCGIFLDLEGKDHYSGNTFAANSKLWMNQDWAIGIDLDREIISSEKEEVIGEIILTKEDSLRSVEELYDEASLWQVGSNRKKVARAKKAFLIKDLEAVMFVCENKLDTDSGLQMRLITELAKTYPDSISPKLILHLSSENKETRKNSITLLGTTKYKEAVIPLIEMLAIKEYEEQYSRIISSLGKIGDSTAVEIIQKFLINKDEIIRLSSVNALQKIKDDEALPSLIAALEDSIFTVRSVASNSFKSFSKEQSCNLLIDNIDKSAYPELFIKALSLICIEIADSSNANEIKLKRELIKLFRKSYNNENNNVRAAAVEALWNTGLKKQQKWIAKKMKTENDVLVKAVFEKVKK